MVLFFSTLGNLCEKVSCDLGNFGTNFSPVHPHLFTRSMRLDNSRHDSGSTHLRQGTETTPLHHIQRKPETNPPYLRISALKLIIYIYMYV